MDIKKKSRLIGLDVEAVQVLKIYEKLSRDISIPLESIRKKDDISQRMFFILSLIKLGEDRPSNLLKHFDILPSTMTLELKRLVDAGLIERTSLSTDLRAVILRPTPKGNRIHRKMTIIINKFMAERLAGISEEDFNRFLRVGQIISKLNM